MPLPAFTVFMAAWSHAVATGLHASLLLATSASSLYAGESSSPDRPATFCNPLDLNYRFQPGLPSRREAADPTLIQFKGEYWLFVSKSGGYWHTKDFLRWDFVVPTGLPLEAYAPTVAMIGGGLYFTAGDARKIFTTADPARGQWTEVADLPKYGDSDLFVDDDGRVYLYQGTSSKKPITGVELDAKARFSEVGTPVDLLIGTPLTHGWELKKPTATDEEIRQGQGLPFIEGAWMTKRDGIYYLQYAGPGTEKKFYADGVYISEHPLGPFRYAPYSPFTLKASGFIGGTGHGSIFQDAKGHDWHVDTMLVGARQGFERRLGLFPTGFVASEGAPAQITSSTYLGDYPQFVPGVAADPLRQNSPGWMLLTYKKAAAASSSKAGFAPEKAFDEDIQTWWSAESGNAGEWLSVDLGKRCEIQAVQINFADEASTALGRSEDCAYRYDLEISDDGQHWSACVSRKDNNRDAPHEYIQLDQPLTARYVRITNVHTPYGAAFSISGLRVFGNGLGRAPAEVGKVTAARLPNRRLGTVQWSAVPGADFYVVRYGIKPDRLFLNVQVYGQTRLELTGLNTEPEYFVSVDAVNDSGVTMGTVAVAMVPAQ